MGMEEDGDGQMGGKEIRVEELDKGGWDLIGVEHLGGEKSVEIAPNV